jgi:hypothetical protein
MFTRQWLIWFLILAPLGCKNGAEQAASEPPTTNLDTQPFSLDTLQRRTFQFFWEQIDSNYQVQDRWPTLNFSSIAATGFGLTAYLVGAERGYISREQAASRVLSTLRVLRNLPQGDQKTGISGYRGFFYHFLDLQHAHRFKTVELSSIDTGLLMAGILSAMSYFDRDDPAEQEIRDLADQIYCRVEWDWMLQPDGLLSMGWHPESGFIPARWAGYNEAMVLLIMAIGSPTHAIPASSWQKWCATYPWAEFMGQEHVNFDPLFGHQYSHMYIDFRGIQDDYMRRHGNDYFENSRRATLAHRAYAIANPLKFNGYSENCWGLTACDGPRDTLAVFGNEKIQFHTYWARGVDARHRNDDGTIAPSAVGGSLPFAPEICQPALQHMWEQYYPWLVGEYGFKDAFNPSYRWGPGNERGWFDIDYLGIDQGPIVLQIENHRSQFVWSLMKKNPYIVAGLRKAGFTGGWLVEAK